MIQQSYSSLTNFVKVFLGEISKMPGRTVIKLYMCIWRPLLDMMSDYWDIPQKRFYKNS